MLFAKQTAKDFSCIWPPVIEYNVVTVRSSLVNMLWLTCFLSGFGCHYHFAGEVGCPGLVSLRTCPWFPLHETSRISKTNSIPKTSSIPRTRSSERMLRAVASYGFLLTLWLLSHPLLAHSHHPLLKEDKRICQQAGILNLFKKGQIQ